MVRFVYWFALFMSAEKRCMHVTCFLNYRSQSIHTSKLTAVLLLKVKTVHSLALTVRAMTLLSIELLKFTCEKPPSLTDTDMTVFWHVLLFTLSVLPIFKSFYRSACVCFWPRPVRSQVCVLNIVHSYGTFIQISQGSLLTANSFMTPYGISAE